MTIKETWIKDKKWNDLDEAAKKAALTQAFDLTNEAAVKKLFQDTELFQFLFAELKVLNMYQSVFEGDDKNKFPVLNCILTSKFLWDSKVEKDQLTTYQNIFTGVVLSNDFRYGPKFNDYQNFLFSDGGLVDNMTNTITLNWISMWGGADTVAYKAKVEKRMIELFEPTSNLLKYSAELQANKDPSVKEVS